MTPEQFSEAREKMNLGSRRAFARAVGISERVAYSYERGHRPIPLVVRLAIAACLAGLPPAGGDEAKEDHPA